jgi:hypothetical protein
MSTDLDRAIWQASGGICEASALPIRVAQDESPQALIQEYMHAAMSGVGPTDRTEAEALAYLMALMRATHECDLLAIARNALTAIRAAVQS